MIISTTNIAASAFAALVAMPQCGNLGYDSYSSQYNLPTAKPAFYGNQEQSALAYSFPYEPAYRQTTEQEKLIAEFMQFKYLNENWDGEGGLAPDQNSVTEAIDFIYILDNIVVPEAMLLSSGHTALFWNENGLYADIEFLGNGRIAYFIRKNDDKHKGVVEFDSKKMPDVFATLLKT
jgi:hypothetical protein